MLMLPRVSSHFVVASVVVLSLGAMSCRPRASRTSRTPSPAANTAQPQTSAPTAKSVLQRADSALARVAELGREDDAVPVAVDNTPRTTWGSAYVPQPDLSEYATFQAALGAYNGKQYENALALFSQVVNSGRPPEMVPNAYYWMGESLYAESRYAESLPYFEYVTRVGPNYKRDVAMYKLSRANLHLGNKQGANLWYERLRNEYPRSSYIATLRKLGAR